MAFNEPVQIQTVPNENNWQDVDGFLQVREDVPTAKPNSVFSQIVVVSGGGSTRAYIYDVAALTWRYVALT